MSTLFYAEDEPDDALLMRQALARVAPDVTLEVVVDGQQALAWLHANPPPQLALLDFNLPLVSGLEVLDWLKRSPAHESLPAIMFSASGRAEDMKVAMMLGADHYIVKHRGSERFEEVARELTARWLPGRGPR